MNSYAYVKCKSAGLLHETCPPHTHKYVYMIRTNRNNRFERGDGGEVEMQGWDAFEALSPQPPRRRRGGGGSSSNSCSKAAKRGKAGKAAAAAAATARHGLTWVFLRFLT